MNEKTAYYLDAAREHLSLWGCSDMANQGMVNMVADAMRKGAATHPGDIVEIEVPTRSSTSKDGLRYKGVLVK
jgi:hypothetical protein